MNKTNNIPRTLSLSVLLIAAIRIFFLLLFSLLAYLTNDPGENVFTYALICKILCDVMCGAITSKAVGDDFSLSTRVFFAIVAVIILNVIELFAGKLIFPGNSTAFYMIPVSAASAFIGSFLTGRKKSSYRKHKRKQRRK